jgi:alpha-L-fucosidase
MDPAAVPYPGASGPGIERALQDGDPHGSVWRPGETDVSIRPGWFYHPAEDAKVKSVDELAGLYFSSVGRNSKLLLNVPPTRAGLLHDTDASRLSGLRDRLTALFARDLSGPRVTWQMTGPRSAVGSTELGGLVRVGLADLREDIAQGQRVARYALEGSDGGPWDVLSRGTTIGYRKLDRFGLAMVRRVRLRIEDAVDKILPVTLRLYRGGN